MKLNFKKGAVIYYQDTPWAKQRLFFVKMPIPHSAHQLEHELVHVRQWWIITILSALVIFGITHVVPAVNLFALGLAPGVMGALTFTSARFRFWSEAQAYRKSARVSPHRFEEFARMLQVEYGTGRSLAECRAAIS